MSTVSNVGQRSTSPPDIELRDKAIFLRVVQLLLDGLKLGVVSTKRDLYYRDVQLFGKQQVVDAVSGRLAGFLVLPRAQKSLMPCGER